MIPITEAHQILDKWFNDGHVGNLVFVHSPSGTGVSVLAERTIKMRELPDDVKGLVEIAFEHLECDKAEIVSAKDGTADRVKVTRWMA